MDKADKEYMKALGLGVELTEADERAVKAYPLLMKGFTQQEVGEGFRAEPWVITVKRARCCVVWVIRDNTLKQTLAGSCDELDGLWGSIEETLGMTRPPWQPMPGKDPQLKKRKPLIQ
jgi:hypothetical protein